jgi:class 3 adenylate cyclase/alpha-beta hydrolase superfamily lysophospholipase
MLVIQRDPVRYATSGDLRIAYQSFGDGPTQIVIVPGFISNLDQVWDTPAFGPIFERLGAVARCVVFDKRGTGLSDRDLGFGSLEERMDDIRAVVDDVGFEEAALFGFSEGGPLSILFAAAYPERATALALYGTMARVRPAPDYPDGVGPELSTPLLEGVESRWGSGTALRAFCQHIPDTPAVREMFARYERGACSPRMARHILERNLEMDVRAVLPTVSTPTLVLHSSGDPLVPAAWGRYVAEHIPGARYVEHEADYHMTYDGEHSWFIDEVVTFLTGVQPAGPKLATERFLATVLFTDIVDSTKQAASLGDRAWRELLDRHDTASRDQVTAFGGRVVKTTGDGVLATLDGPSRAVECAVAIRDAVDPLGLKIRAGVHTGEVERRGDDVGGIGVNIGSRVAALAGPGEVWVSRTVKDLTTGSGLEFLERGRHELKGVPEEWELFALV